MTCLCSHNKMFVCNCCWEHDHLDLWNKPPLMVRGLNRGVGNDTANSETVTRGEVLRNQQPHDCNGFMLVFKQTNDRDQNVFLQPFTDVEIRSKSHPLKYMEGRQRRVMWRKNQGKKGTFSLYSGQNSPGCNLFVSLISRNVTLSLRFVASMEFFQRWFHFGSWKRSKESLKKGGFLAFRETEIEFNVVFNLWEMQTIVLVSCLQQRLTSLHTYSALGVSEAQSSAQQRKSWWGSVVHCCPLLTNFKQYWDCERNSGCSARKIL